MRAAFVKKEKIGSNIWNLHFKPESKIRYIAGQFIEMYLPHMETDERGDKRWLTISSAPQNDLITVTTKLHKTSPSTFKQALFNLKDGQFVNISSPMGDFVLPKINTIPIIFIAGGIGYTPFKSILEDSLYKNENRDITLMHVLKEDLAINSFKALGSSYKVIESARNNEIVDQIKEIVTPAHYIYVSGPELFVEQQLEKLENIKIERSQIFTDFFHGYDE